MVVSNRKLTELQNIGKKLAARLNEVGIFSEDELRCVGAVAAHRMLKQTYPNETLPLCYYLYSLEGALLDMHWHAIGEARKAALRNQLEGGVA